MWIVKVALNRPYTFIVLAVLILIAAPVVILRTPTDIFPSINISVVSTGRTYTGLNPEELEGRLTTPYEKAMTTLVDNIQHIESTTYNGEAIEDGVDSYLQVITWQTALLENELNDIAITQRRYEASVLLVKALGGGWDASQPPPSALTNSTLDSKRRCVIAMSLSSFSRRAVAR